VRRLVIVAVSGIALLGAAALAMVLLATPGGPPPPAPSPDPSPVTTGEPPRVGSPSLPSQPGLPAGLAAVGQPPPESLHEDPPPPPDPRSWEAVAPAGRVASIPGVGPEIGRALNELHPRLSECFTARGQGAGAGGLTTVKDAQPLGEAGLAILMLQIETGNGQVSIVDAPVETRGEASDATLACAQRALRGASLYAPTAQPGQRLRVRYPLLP
jgi:hypothetical protein